MKMKNLVFCLVIQAGILSISSEKCLSRDYGNGGTVCICNKNHCDTLEPVKKVQQLSLLKYTSNRDGLRFEKEIENFTKTSNSKNKIVIRSDEVFQKINGFGGAFTDSAGINIMSLDEDVREKLMRAYFSEDGIEYSLCRVPMAATDFSTHPYTYHDQEDKTLSNFTLAPEDFKYKLPLLNWARNLTNNKLEFFVSTWIAPKWMKTNGKYEDIIGTLKKEMYQIWANYFVKFLDAYKKEGITFWGITTGNEPSNGFLPLLKIPSVGWTADMQKIWLRDNLGPTIRNSSHSNIKIIILDDQRIHIPAFVDEVFSDEKAKNFADGIGLHWYLDGTVSPKTITDSQLKYPKKFFLATEASTGSFTLHPVQLGLWERAEQYAASVIEDVNHWVTGWMDWNMVLNLKGGPTYISNFCDAPILVNVTGQEFLKQPMYYGLGHFSKFVPRDSQRILTSGFDDDVPLTAFKRPDGGIVLVILNKKHQHLEAVVEDKNRGNVGVNLTAHSITTIVYW